MARATRKIRESLRKKLGNSPYRMALKNICNTEANESVTLQHIDRFFGGNTIPEDKMLIIVNGINKLVALRKQNMAGIEKLALVKL